MTGPLIVNVEDGDYIPTLAEEDGRWYLFGEETQSPETVLAAFLMCASESPMGEA